MTSHWKDLEAESTASSRFFLPRFFSGNLPVPPNFFSFGLVWEKLGGVFSTAVD